MQLNEFVGERELLSSMTRLGHQDRGNRAWVRVGTVHWDIAPIIMTDGRQAESLPGNPTEDELVCTI